MEGTDDEHILKINYIRSLTRILVKNTRPLLYLGDRILKDNFRYLKYNDMKRSNLDNLQSIDFGIDKLYNFALSTRELADKLLDIYSLVLSLPKFLIISVFIGLLKILASDNEIQ